tara:strand:- start:1029 stop:1436 length:408 start_codon:yes stop_codon:yes gene_type:complete
MLDVLLVTMSLIAVVSMFFLCWLTWTLNEQLQNNDNVVNELQDEIDMLRKERTLRQAILESEKKSSRDKDQTIKDLEEIEDLDSSRIIRLNNTINKKNDEIDTLRKSREEDRKNWKLDNKLVKMYQKEKLEQNKQ